jgi:branched-subunit amino acid ABC-type transport system permease component
LDKKYPASTINVLINIAKGNSFIIGNYYNIFVQYILLNHWIDIIVLNISTYFSRACVWITKTKACAHARMFWGSYTLCIIIAVLVVIIFIMNYTRCELMFPKLLKILRNLGHFWISRLLISHYKANILIMSCYPFT